MEIEQVVGTAELRATDDQLRDPDTLPWVPQVDGVWVKPLRICPSRGRWTNLLRVTKRGTINLHRHLDAVEAWVIKGEWRYLERNWVGRPGHMSSEPPGDIHTLVNTAKAKW